MIDYNIISCNKQHPTGTSSPMGIRMPTPSGSHTYSPNVPRAGLAPGAAAAMEQARRRQQDLKSRRRYNFHMIV